MIGVGQKFPQFSKKSVVSLEAGKEFEVLSNDFHMKDGKWLVMFFWPKDFTFVCPTEISAFSDVYESFSSRDTEVIGASTDTEFVHLAWRNAHPDLKGLKFPMLADTSKSLSRDLGVLTADNEEICYRATYIVDPKGTIRWVCVNDLAVGRNIDEVVRVLDALQTGKLAPCNWKKGAATLN